MNNQEYICGTCGEGVGHNSQGWHHSGWAQGLIYNHNPNPKPNPDPKVAHLLDELASEIKYPSSTPKVEQVAKRPSKYQDAWNDPGYYHANEADALFDEQDARIASLEKELRKANRSFDDLRKADQASLAEALAAAIEQSQRAEKAECLVKEWIDEYTNLRDGGHIAGYEKELRDYKRALELATSHGAQYLEAARREQE